MEEKPRIEVRWYSDEKRIIHVIFHTKWEWKDFHEQRAKAYALLRQNAYNVAFLMEWDKDAPMSPTNTFSKLSKSVETAAENIGMVVLVKPSPIWQVILQTLKRLMPNRILRHTYIVNSREEALLLLKPYLNGATAHKA
jgi:hypothetical protein